MQSFVLLGDFAALRASFLVLAMLALPLAAQAQDKTPAEAAFESSGAAYYYALTSYDKAVDGGLDALTIAARGDALDLAIDTFLLSIQGIESEAQADGYGAKFAIITASFYAVIHWQQQGLVLSLDPSDVNAQNAYDAAWASVEYYLNFFENDLGYYDKLIPPMPPPS